jgi:hypothetical protein
MNHSTLRWSSKSSTSRLDAVFLGDSWVDGTWCGYHTWPIQLAVQQDWSYLNVGKVGKCMPDLARQMALVASELEANKLVVDSETLWIIHMGGNDLLHAIFPNFFWQVLDLGRMHLSYSVGSQLVPSVGDWINTYTGSKVNYSDPTSFQDEYRTCYPSAGRLIAHRTFGTLSQLQSQFGANRFLVASNTTSSAMPLCRLISFAVSPFRGIRLIDFIALTVGLQLVQALTSFVHARESKEEKRPQVWFLDEDVLCRRARASHATFDWRWDGFHPLSTGHAYLAKECALVLERSEPMEQVSQRKMKQLETIVAHEWTVRGLVEGCFALLLTGIVGLLLGVLVGILRFYFCLWDCFCISKTKEPSVTQIKAQDRFRSRRVSDEWKSSKRHFDNQRSIAEQLKSSVD